MWSSHHDPPGRTRTGPWLACQGRYARRRRHLGTDSRARTSATSSASSAAFTRWDFANTVWRPSGSGSSATCTRSWTATSPASSLARQPRPRLLATTRRRRFETVAKDADRHRSRDMQYRRRMAFYSAFGEIVDPSGRRQTRRCQRLARPGRHLLPRGRRRCRDRMALPRPPPGRVRLRGHSRGRNRYRPVPPTTPSRRCGFPPVWSTAALSPTSKRCQSSSIPPWDFRRATGSASWRRRP